LLRIDSYLLFFLDIKLVSRNVWNKAYFCKHSQISPVSASELCDTRSSLLLVTQPIGYGNLKPRQGHLRPRYIKPLEIPD